MTKLFEEKRNIGFCEQCSTEDELWPATTGDKNICFSCAMKDNKEVQHLYELLNRSHT